MLPMYGKKCWPGIVRNLVLSMIPFMIDRIIKTILLNKKHMLRSGHTKDYYKNGTNCIFAWHAVVRIEVWQCNPAM